MVDAKFFNLPRKTGQGTVKAV